MGPPTPHPETTLSGPFFSALIWCQEEDNSSPSHPDTTRVHSSLPRPFLTPHVCAHVVRTGPDPAVAVVIFVVATAAIPWEGSLCQPHPTPQSSHRGPPGLLLPSWLRGVCGIMVGRRGNFAQKTQVALSPAPQTAGATLCPGLASGVPVLS